MISVFDCNKTSGYVSKSSEEICTIVKTEVSRKTAVAGAAESVCDHIVGSKVVDKSEA